MLKKDTVKKQIGKAMRKNRVRARITGTAIRPRLSVFRSLKHIYAQLIDDEKGVTIAAARDEEVKDKKKSAKAESARLVGAEIAKKVATKGIKKVVSMESRDLFSGACLPTN